MLAIVLPNFLVCCCCCGHTLLVLILPLPPRPAAAAGEGAVLVAFEEDRTPPSSQLMSPLTSTLALANTLSQLQVHLGNHCV
jgi:hypothetical protein